MATKTINLRAGLESVMKMVQGKTRAQFVKQGHHLGGQAEESMQFKVYQQGGNWIGVLEANDYVLYLELGVKWSKKAGGGRGGKSARIEGYFQYWKRRGLPEREAMSAAFALKKVHDREDMPSRASFRFSRTGERTGFVKRVVSDNLDEIANIISEALVNQVTVNLADTFRLQRFTVPV